MSANNETEYLAAADDSNLEPKFQEIVVDHQLEPEEEHHYIEIVKYKDGKMATRFVDASSLGANAETTMVQGEHIVELDLMNYRIVNCNDEDVVQEIITGGGEDSDGQHTQYVLQTAAEDAEDVKNVVAVSDLQQEDNSSTQYMHIVEKDSVPLVFFSDKPITTEMQQIEPRKQIEPKIRQKKGDFVLSEAMVGSPKFRLYLYNCKHCDFKCNAIKELTAHRTQEHTPNGINIRYRNVMPVPQTQQVIPSSEMESMDAHVIFGSNMSYCSGCSYSSISPHQIRRHISKVHHGTGKKSSNDNEVVSKYENIYSKEKNRKDRMFNQASSSSEIMYYCNNCSIPFYSTEDYKKHVCQQKSSRNFR